jgi:hypothetical protein
MFWLHHWVMPVQILTLIYELHQQRNEGYMN